MHAADDPTVAVAAPAVIDGVRGNPGPPSRLDPRATSATHDLPGQRLEEAGTIHSALKTRMVYPAMAEVRSDGVYSQSGKHKCPSQTRSCGVQGK